MAVTRIKNNQITDSSAGNTQVGINAGTKLQNYSITAGKIANNLTYGSDLTVTGNLTVQGNATSIDTTITTIEDPVIVLASTQTGAPAVDIGFIGERGSSENIAFVWDESAQEFVTAFTNTSETNTTINITGYANARVGNMIVGGTTSLAGNIIGTANFTGNVNAGNLTAVDRVTAASTVGGVITGSSASVTGGVTAASVAGGVITGTSASVTGGVTAASVAGGVITGTSTSVTGTQTAASTVGGVITGSSVSVTGGVTAASVAGGVITGTSTSVTGSQTAASTVGGVITGSSVSVTGGVTAASVAGGVITGTSTSVTGSQTAASTVGGVITGSSVSVTGNVNAAGNVTAAWLIGNIQGSISSPGANTQIIFNDSGVANATSGFTFDKTSNLVTVGGNVNASNFNGNVFGTTVSASGTVTAASTVGGVITGSSVSVTGGVTAASVAGGVITGTSTSVTGTQTAASTVGGVITGSSVSVTGTATAASTVGGVITGSSASVTGNVSGGNLNITGNIVDTGALTIITGSNGNIDLSPNGTGNVNTGANLSVTGGVTAASVAGGVITGTSVSVTGGVTAASVAGGVITGTSTSVTGTQTAASTVGGVITGSTVSTTGNITGPNVNAAQLYNATAVTIRAGSGNINLDTTSGNIVVNNTYINGLQLNPVQDSDAASKYYVDLLASTALAYHEAVFVATTTTLATATGGTITYAQPNGVSNGVGATLTTTGTFNLIDTANVQTVGTRILVKDQANAVQNGIYVWSNATVITRATDADQYGPNDAEAFSVNDYFFVSSGNVNLGSAYVVDAPQGVITFGTSNIQFAQFSQAQIYSANTAAGLLLVGQTFNAKVDNDTTAFDGSGNISVKAGANLTTPNIGAATGTSLSVTGTVTAASTVGGVITGSSASVTGGVTAASVAGGVITGTSVSVTGGVTAASVAGGVITGTSTSVTGTQTAASTVGGVITGSSVSVTGTATAASTVGGIITGTSVSTTGNITTASTANISTGNLSVTNATTSATVSASGNITGGNLLTGGLISATANITGGNVLSGGLISATGNINSGANIVATANVIGGNVSTAGLITATGNVTGGNVLTGGLISATATVTGGNLATGGTISGTGNITGGNILTGGLISAAGNIIANPSSFFIGNGSQLTGVISSQSGFPVIAGTSNIAAATNGNIGVSIGGTSNVLLVTSTGTITTGTASVTGNVVAGNVVVPGGNIDVTNFINTGALIATGRVDAGTTMSAAGNITGANIITGGLITATGNINSTANVSGGNIITGGVVSATANIRGGNINTGGIVSATGNVTSAANVSGGNVLTGGVVSATGNVTGGNLILTSGFVDGPAAGRITINGSDLDTDFAVDGDTLANVFYVDAGTGTASFGDSTQVTNAIVNFATTTSIKTPVGNTQQRPSVGVTGMLRFNTTTDALEIYDNDSWASVGTPVFTVIDDEQFAGDGSTVAFTLNSTQTTNSCIVSINGVVQIPTLAYSVAGTNPTCVLTFTEAPASGDVIDVRQITTTTSVTSISNTSGNAVVSVSPTEALVNVTGDLSVAGTIIGGNINSAAISNGTSNMTVISSGGNIRANVGGTTVMTISPGLVDIVGNLTVSGNATLSGNILGDRVQNGTTSIDIQTPNGNANITVGGTSNVAVFNTGGLVMAGNITPTANITYDLGTSTQRWKDIWLANSTIYLGNSQISANATSLIFTNPQGGQTVLAGTSSAITGASVSVTGGVTAASVAGGVITGTSTSVTGTQTAASTVGGVITGSSASVSGTVTAASTVGGVITGSSASVTGAVTSGSISTAGNIVSTASNATANIGSASTYFNTVHAKATSAQYADLAEKYAADADYAPGTVVMFGGTAEVTICSNDACARVAGVVSTNPSYRMNDGLQSEHTAMVALTGRVPTSVTGTVRKGDMMVSAGNGTARAEANPTIGTVIGKALADSEGDAVIEVVVGRV